MDGKETSEFKSLKHQLLAAVLFNFNLHPSITNYGHNVPKLWEKKTKKPVKTSAVIRFLANFMPEKGAKRIYMQKELIEPLVTEMEKDTSSDRLWQLPSPVSIADIPWLEKIEPDPCVRQRIEVLTRILEEDSQPERKRQKTEHVSCLCTPGLDSYKCCPCQSQESGYRTSLGTSFGTPSFTTASVSTPLPSANITSSPDLATKQRISDLEQMVQMLKDQISNMATQIQLNQSMAAGTAVAVPPLPPVPTAPGGPPPPPPPHGGPPPPPPPPPPPVMAPKQVMSISEIIKQNKAKNGKDTGSTVKSNTPQGNIDMREVLKGLGSVKLKTVPRSPGGTPLKQDTLPCDVNDHAAVFARALKRKFSMCPVGSPDSEKENNTPPGPHILKKITANRKLLRRSKPLANVTNSS